MKKIIILLIIAQLFFGCSKNQNEVKEYGTIKNLSGSKRTVDQSLIFADVSGIEYKLEQFKGKVILMNFWTSWVVSVPEEMQKLNRLQNELNNPDFQIVSVSLDDPYSANLKEFLAANQLNFNIFISQNNSEVNKNFSEIANKIPCYYIINKKFEIVNHFTDPLDIEQTKKLIKEYINDK